MGNHEWVDEEANRWSKNHKRLKNLKRDKTVSIQLEQRKKFVILTREEFKILNEFVANHQLSDITTNDIMDLPPKVCAVVYDWFKFR